MNNPAPEDETSAEASTKNETSMAIQPSVDSIDELKSMHLKEIIELKVKILYIFFVLSILFC